MYLFMSSFSGRIARFFVPPESALVPPRRRHWQMLIVATIVTLLSLILEFTPSGHLAFPFLRSAPIPSVCPSQSLFGADCPGCGLTRSFVALAHGNLQESLHFHPLGWLVALLIVLQFPYRLVALRNPDRRLLPRPIPDFIAWGLFIALVAQWAVRLLV